MWLCLGDDEGNSGSGDGQIVVLTITMVVMEIHD